VIVGPRPWRARLSATQTRISAGPSVLARTLADEGVEVGLADSAGPRAELEAAELAAGDELPRPGVAELEPFGDLADGEELLGRKAGTTFCPPLP
jgi:hypothetical protein